MEGRATCASHGGKPLEWFCWDCQALICGFCVQEHSRRLHRAYSLLRPSNRQKGRSRGREESSSEREKHRNTSQEPAEETKTIPKLTEARKAPAKKPPTSSPGGDILCMKCGKAAEVAKDLTLSCGHSVHANCLKEYPRGSCR